MGLGRRLNYWLQGINSIARGSFPRVLPLVPEDQKWIKLRNGGEMMLNNQFAAHGSWIQLCSL